MGVKIAKWVVYIVNMGLDKLFDVSQHVIQGSRMIFIVHLRSCCNKNL